MDILQAARVLQPGTSWTVIGDPNNPNSPLVQAADGTLRVAVPTPAQLAPVMTSDTTAAAITAAQRANAITELLSDPSQQAKFIRAVLLVILDEINVIRALLPGPPVPRTVLQMETAIQNKINAGTAD